MRCVWPMTMSILLVSRQDMPIQLALQVEDLDVKSDIAIPLDLILNKFATNSRKYSFTDKSEADTGFISGDARRRDGWLHIRIWNNGNGLSVKDRARAWGQVQPLLKGLPGRLGQHRNGLARMARDCIWKFHIAHEHIKLTDCILPRILFHRSYVISLTTYSFTYIFAIYLYRYK